ncbi:hypothetical protein [Alkaliphilus sp. B6464]|nr:hypothetical protein [Alkaliphilus sp. B6464]QUH20920.1 hypothetical protein HYG84_14230 [Alkaliphilus sp. B6464]
MKKKGTGLLITHRIEGGHTLEEVQKALAQKLKVVTTKDFPSLKEYAEVD